MLCLCVAAGTYAADCKCDNEHHCDGVRLHDDNARRCTAFHRALSSTRIRVSKEYIIAEQYTYSKIPFSLLVFAVS